MDVWTLWRGQPDTSRRLLAVLVVGSVLLHLPLTPWASLVSLLRGLSDAGERVPDSPPLTTIPLELLDDDTFGTPPPAAAAPAAPAVPVPEPTLVGEIPAPQQPDAGVKEDAGAKSEPRDAGAPDSGTDGDAGPLDAGLDGDVSRDAGLSDPVALTRAARRIADPNANVKLTLYNARIRAHPLGPRIGRILGSVYQWRDFFGPAGLDPIQDVDQLIVIGPQFRDSSGVIVFIKMNVPEERLKPAIDALVRKDPEGSWLDAGVPQAMARADRAPRVFTLPAPGTVVVTPPGEPAKMAAGLGRGKIFDTRAGDQVAAALVKTPWRALSGLFRVPKSIQVARLWVYPTPEKGALIQIEADDESPEAAAESADYLGRAVLAATQFEIPFLGRTRFVEKVEFSAQGSTITGRLTLTQNQLLTALDFAEPYLVPRRVRPAGSAAP